MTEREAIEWIKELKVSEEIQEFYYAESFIKAFDIAIQALEKQIPKKPIDRCMYEECPTCGNVEIVFCKHCPDCGQRLDWRDENEID